MDLRRLSVVGWAAGSATEEMRGILPGYVNPCCARASAVHEALLTRNACLFSILPLKAPLHVFLSAVARFGRRLRETSPCFCMYGDSPPPNHFRVD